MKMTFGRLGTGTCAVIATTAMLGSGSARAGDGDQGLPALKPYVGAFAGLHVVAGNWDIGREGDRAVAPESGVTYGVRGGLQVTHWFGFEGEIGFVPVNLDDGQGEGLAMAWGLNTLWSPLDYKLSPYVLLGLGMYQATGSDLGLDADWDFHWGLGLRTMLTDWVDFRIEGRHIVTDCFTSGLASNFAWTLGVECFL